MRLRTVLSNFPKDMLDVLESFNIRTGSDMLMWQSTIELFQHLPPGSLSFADLERARKQVVEFFAAKGTNGNKFLQEEIAQKSAYKKQSCSTGDPQFDRLLHAAGPSVIEIAGGRCSGKTVAIARALALSIALAYLVDSPDTTVHWIDTTGDFSAERASVTLYHLLKTQDSKKSALIDDRVLERLRVSLAFDAENLYQILEQIRSASSRNPGAQRSSVCLIIIDPVTSLFGPHLATGSSEGHAVMTTILRELRTLATMHGILTLVINNATQALPSNSLSVFAATKTRPALGPTFTFLTDTTIWLSSAKDVLNTPAEEPLRSGENEETGTEDTNNLFFAEVLRSRSMPEHTWWAFRIDGGTLCAA